MNLTLNSCIHIACMNQVEVLITHCFCISYKLEYDPHHHQHITERVALTF